MSKFTGTQFVCHVSRDMTFNRYGDLVIQLTVPYQFKHLAIPLSDAFGLPLHVDLQIWKPYEDKVEKAG